MFGNYLKPTSFSNNHAAQQQLGQLNYSSNVSKWVHNTSNSKHTFVKKPIEADHQAKNNLDRSCYDNI
jgi:hypothetical protein